MFHQTGEATVGSKWQIDFQFLAATHAGPCHASAKQKFCVGLHPISTAFFCMLVPRLDLCEEWDVLHICI